MTLLDASSALIPAYPYRIPVSFIRGQGVWLWSKDDEPYLDALSARGVCNLGHNHPYVVQTLKEQAEQIIHTSNLYRIPKQEELAVSLCHQFNMVQAFFSNSGAESIEAALKIAYLDAQRRSIQNPLIITLKGSYHGRTLGALQASQSFQLIKEKEAINLSNTNIIAIPADNIEILEQTIKQHAKRIAAILIEPVIGDGGIHPCSSLFLQKVRALSDEYNYLMIADEIQTGLCRTGPFSACEIANIQPDVIVLAKALGNGFPIGAYLINERAKDLLNNYHGSTFAGNPLGSAVALSVIKTLNSEAVTSNVIAQGSYLKKELEKQIKPYSMVQSIRGAGLMLGIELDHPCKRIIETALKHKLLFDVVATSTIRLLPPLVITRKEVKELVKRLVQTFNSYTLTK